MWQIYKINFKQRNGQKNGSRLSRADCLKNEKAGDFILCGVSGR
jgi:hypothetical protein